jgi:signal transduction histidine kinase
MPRRASPYLVAAAATACAGIANAGLWPVLGARYPLIAFFPAIAVTAWFGGFGPGTLSTALSAVTGGYFWFAPQFSGRPFWFAPQFSGRPSHQGDAVILVLFVGIGLTIASLFETLRRRSQRAEQAEAVAVRLADELRLSSQRLLAAEQAARRLAEDANQIKNAFLATVSHELRTPLGAILGWTEILKQKIVTDEQRHRALQAIYRNAQLQAQLLGELLEAARIDSDTFRLERARVDLGAVVSDAWEAVEPAAAAKQIQASIHIASDVSAISFHADAARLRQIVTNLFSNAVKFTPNGGQVSAQVRQDDGAVELVVSDTGCGIPDDFLPFVFEPFRQADGSKPGPDSGFGLGLSIAKHLVEAHGGEIRAASNGDNRGATFTVRLPLTPALVLAASATEAARAARRRA